MLDGLSQPRLNKLKECCSVMYQEFLTLTGRNVSYETYAKKIEPQYMDSLLNKQDFCEKYVESTKRTRKAVDNANGFNRDKVTKAATFKTALKHLSKMVQENDGDVFYMDDILWNIERLVNKWHKAQEDNKERIFPLLEYELREFVAEEGGDIKKRDYYRDFATDTEYYNYWITPEGTYFRLQIELYEDNRAYIDCGYKF